MGIARHYADRVKGMKPVGIRQVVARTQDPHIISFTAGKPAPSMFPLGATAETAGIVIEKYGAAAMQYSATEGFLPLREFIANRYPHVTANDVRIISGSQQAIDICGKVFLNPHDKVVVSSPTYMGAITSLNVYEPTYLTVACDEQGMLPDSLEAALKQSPKLLYCTPNFMNPTGVDMSLERRQITVELAQKYDVPILEDDPYGTLRFEGEPLPSLFEFAPEQVIYAGTFSKILAPGLRMAWVMSPTDVIRPITLAKQGSDLQNSIFVQMLTYELCQDNFMDQQIARTQTYYHQQRDHMATAMAKYFPPEAKYNVPSGGMFFWVTLPEGQDALELLETAIDHQVAYIPGSSFFAEGGNDNTLRLSFSLATPAQIDEGIKRLGNIFREAFGS